MHVNLGDKVRDSVTGYSGTCIAVGDFSTGGRLALIQPPCRLDGAMPEPCWIAEDRLNVCTGDNLMLPVENAERSPRSGSDAAQRKFERWQTPLGIFVKKYGADNIAGKLRCTGRAVRGWVSGFHPGPQLARRLVALAVENGVHLTLEDLRNQAVLCGR